MHRLRYRLQLGGRTARVRLWRVEWLSGNQPAVAARAVLDEAPAIVPNDFVGFVERRRRWV